MAHYHTDAEMARLLERYSKPAFVPVIMPPPKPKPQNGEESLIEVRKLSENAVNSICQ